MATDEVLPPLAYPERRRRRHSHRQRQRNEPLEARAERVRARGRREAAEHSVDVEPGADGDGKDSGAAAPSAPAAPAAVVQQMYEPFPMNRDDDEWSKRCSDLKESVHHAERCFMCRYSDRNDDGTQNRHIASLQGDCDYLYGRCSNREVCRLIRDKWSRTLKEDSGMDDWPMESIFWHFMVLSVSVTVQQKQKSIAANAMLWHLAQTQIAKRDTQSGEIIMDLRCVKAWIDLATKVAVVPVSRKQ